MTGLPARESPGLYNSPPVKPPKTDEPELRSDGDRRKRGRQTHEGRRNRLEVRGQRSPPTRIPILVKVSEREAPGPSINRKRKKGPEARTNRTQAASATT